MKILLDPNIAILIKDMSDAECAEILKCIFEYPNRDCEIGLWKYIKTQIDRDARKYKDKCDRAAHARDTQTLKLDLKSELKSDLKLGVKKSSIEKDNDKDIDIEKEKDSSMSISPVENSVENVENHVEKILIDENFKFQNIKIIIPAFARYIAPFLPAVISRAERTIIQKRYGQRLTRKQIVEWIEQERMFYQQNHKDMK